ncbi:HlyC/CorC family transporter [Candidatus Parcubacteria bacterium]|nr:MAG: HlyC/CorC family transporter [Candidatus Parcubacteria bacterium]
MEILIIFILVIINGIFAMAEIAIISARKYKLQQQANEGNINAKISLNLASSPNKFLSTIQIGITFVGIFAGVFGGAKIADPLSFYLKSFEFIAPYSDIIALSIVVLFITYLSLIIGELVPKRLALAYPETIANLLARPMIVISEITSPLVSFLSISTDLVLNLLRIRKPEEILISEEEVKTLIREGAKTGVFDIVEKDIVERTFKVNDKKVKALMTPRNEIQWLDIDSSNKAILDKIAKNPQPSYPICRRSLDKVIGVVITEDLLTHHLRGDGIDLLKFLQKPLLIPENTRALKLLELFKKSGNHLAIILDEYGSVQGLISLSDIIKAIVGNIPSSEDSDEKEIIKLKDGSWLIDGLVNIDEFKEYFKIKNLPGEKASNFHTIGGFVVSRLNKIPKEGDYFEWEGLRFEVVDMDENRVDKVMLVRPVNKEQASDI